MLTRAEQDAILMPIVLGCRLIDHGLGSDYAEVRNEHHLASFRASLRLDDPKLDDIIAKGEPLCWSPSSPVS